VIEVTRFRLRVRFAVVAIVLSAVIPAWAQDTHQYFVRFRDGSVISMELPDHLIQWQSVSEDGRITPLALPISEVAQLELVLSPVTERVRTVRRLIDDLGNEDYQVRENASRELLSQAGPFLSVVEASRGSLDPEVSWRLEVVYQTLQGGLDQPETPSYDRLSLNPDSKLQVLPGIAGDWGVVGNYRGFEIPLSRENVKSISRGPTPDIASLAEARMGERLNEEDIDRLPEDHFHVDFDTNSKGEDIERGSVINNEFVGMGVQLSSTIENGFIGVFSYSVPGSLSGNNSAGGQWAKDSNQDYKGMTTVKFCVPGQPDVPAGVNYFGCYLSIVVKDGTLLRFFDGRGHLISEQLTDNSRDEQTDFVGFYSPVPIARVEIHPTVADKNYAFDDFLFDQPKSLVVDEVQNRLTVVTRLGEKVEGTGWSVDRSGVKYTDLTVGDLQVDYPRDQIAALIQHFYDSDASANTLALWGQTTHGSLLRLKAEGALLKSELAPETTFTIEDFTTLWSGYVFEPDQILESLPAEMKFPVRQIDEQLDSVKELELTARGFKIEGNDETIYDYDSESLPLVVIRPAPAVASNFGRLLTVDDQRLIIDGKRISLVDWDSDGIELKLGEQKLKLGWNQVRYLRFPD
jgi:hypothetical protein